MSGTGFYNLFDERWITVEDLKGDIRELSLYEVLKNSHEIKQLMEENPIFQMSIYRLLISLIMDIFRLGDRLDLEDLLNRGKFDTGEIDLFKTNYYDKFFLFKEKGAFYQGDYVENLPTKSVSQLFMYIPTGNNETFFYHSFDGIHAIAPKYCVKALLTWPLFSTVGGAGYSPGINQKPPWYVLINGKNLFSSIVLNISVQEISENSGDPITPWNSNKYIGKGKKVEKVSTIYGMTFLPRYIHLIPGNGGYCTYSGEWSEHLVREIIFQWGNKFTGNWIDPNIGYIIDAKRGLRPLRPAEGSRIWQHLSPLILLKEKDEIPSINGKKKGNKYKRAAIIDQYIDMQVFSEEISRDEVLILEIYGIRSDKAKIFEWYKEIFTLPMNLMLIENIGKYVHELVNLAQNLARTIEVSIEFIFREDSNKSKSKSKSKPKSSKHSISIRASREYLSKMETIFKHEFIPKIGNLNPKDLDISNKLDTIKKEWGRQASEEAKSIIEHYLDFFDTSAKLLKRKSRAERYFYGARKGILDSIGIDLGKKIIQEVDTL
ncbi:MAG: type I-E CRISPR-associated protein Cse1/CasA [Candidatus Helarchaeota archaeon]